MTAFYIILKWNVEDLWVASDLQGGRGGKREDKSSRSVSMIYVFSPEKCAHCHCLCHCPASCAGAAASPHAGALARRVRKWGGEGAETWHQLAHEHSGERSTMHPPFPSSEKRRVLLSCS